MKQKRIFLFFVFLAVFSSLCYSTAKNRPSTCPKGFALPDLNSEKYQPKALKAAMNSLNYANIIENYHRPSQKDTVALFHLYRNGTDREKERAFQILFLSHLYLVHFLVKQERGRARNLYDDLFQEGAIALLNSLKHFDPLKGISFSTYLYQAISSRLTNYITRKVRTIPLKWSPQRREIYRLFQPYRNLVDFESNLELYIHKIAEENPGYSIANIRMVSQFISPPRFLGYDTPINNKEDSGTVGELISDTRIDVEAEAIREIDLQRMDSWAKKRFQDEIDQTILRDMLFSSDPKTFTEIGKSFSITRQAIEHRYRKIIRIIKAEFLND